MRRAALTAIVLLMPVAAIAGTQSQTRIAHGFTHLGMSSKTAACYGAAISRRLDRQEAQKAASIVESADSGRQVRVEVAKAGGAMVNAFSAARKSCGT